jgi:hypothetical protein
MEGKKQVPSTRNQPKIGESRPFEEAFISLSGPTGRNAIVRHRNPLKEVVTTRNNGS